MRLENDAIIKAKANDEDNPQLFRIYNHTKAVGENTTWYGEHISYELNGNPVDCFTVSEVNGERALHELLDAAILPHEFTCASDITTTNSTSIDGAVSVRNAMGGTEGSLLDVWCGEYHYDNYRVELLKARGVDNGVTIEYGKNLIDAKQEKNIADVVTVIFPYAKYTAEGAEQKTYITLPEKVLQHENANKYANNKYYTYTANSKNNSTSTSGSSGLKQTQKPESALCFDKTLAGAYVVTADKLHMRAGAGKTKADYGTIAEGGKVHCYGYYNKEKGTGAKWLYVACGNVTGYCHSDYLKRA